MRACSFQPEDLVICGLQEGNVALCRRRRDGQWFALAMWLLRRIVAPGCIAFACVPASQCNGTMYNLSSLPPPSPTRVVYMQSFCFSNHSIPATLTNLAVNRRQL
jgi:hypothetical protein